MFHIYPLSHLGTGKRRQPKFLSHVLQFGQRHSQQGRLVHIFVYFLHASSLYPQQTPGQPLTATFRPILCKVNANKQKYKIIFDLFDFTTQNHINSATDIHLYKGPLLPQFYF